ncbi:MAG: 3-keto-disaccharide hydrolase [Phycisphaeraceae bacterium]
MPNTTRLVAILLVTLCTLTGCELLPETTGAPLAEADRDDGFVSVFNGKDLTGWTPKIRGLALGEDPKNTFRVVDGAIAVRYDKYDRFSEQFGHLFLDTPYSHYILRLEYRFVGDKQLDGHPGGWAFMNSGVMIHGQAPDTMGKDQDFPKSIEVQLLGQRQDAPKSRPTANVCSPGTHYVRDGKLVRAHCVPSTSETFRGEQWVPLEIEVRGSERIIHRVAGEVVFDYTKPQLNDGTLLEGGSISLQSESHACDFRNIEIKVLEK